MRIIIKSCTYRAIIIKLNFWKYWQSEFTNSTLLYLINVFADVFSVAHGVVEIDMNRFQEVPFSFDSLSFSNRLLVQGYYHN